MRFLCLAGLFLFTGCGGGSDPVRGTIDEMVRAAEKRDAPSMMARLAPDFQAADGTGRADMESALRGYFAGYDGLNVRISDLVIERAAGAARARFRADLSGKPRQIAGLDGWLPRTASYRFDLRLSPDLSGRWMVTSAGWEEASGR
ncbi:MAG TPA: hypothetical protein VGA31_00565 [Thermoanaerobaculia bacterium]